MHRLNLDLIILLIIEIAKKVLPRVTELAGLRHELR